MTSAEFAHALDRWGADLARWPTDTARAAAVLLRRDPDARRLLQAARLVESHLAGLSVHAPPPGLAGRIVADAGDRRRADPLDALLVWFASRLWRPAVSALLLAGAGFFTGTIVTGPDIDAALAQDVMSLPFTDIYAELDDAER